MRRRITSAAAAAAALAPAPALAATTMLQIAQDLHNHVYNAALAVLGGAALALFLWGVVKYIWGAGEGHVKEGISMMTYGLLVLFVMVSVWAILAVLIQALGFGPLSGFGIGSK